MLQEFICNISPEKHMFKSGDAAIKVVDDILFVEI